MVRIRYGTTEPLRRVVAGEELIFYDPVNFTELGRVRTVSAATADSPLQDYCYAFWAQKSPRTVHKSSLVPASQVSSHRSAVGVLGRGAHAALARD